MMVVGLADVLRLVYDTAAVLGMRHVAEDGAVWGVS
jgi:hypothetical protein